MRIHTYVHTPVHTVFMQPGVRDGNDIFGPLALAINLPFVVMTWGWFMAWGLPPDHQFPIFKYGS